MMKANSPFISVFTPCYNGEKTIRKVADCINSQTFRDFEWIIYNDGSTDDSHNVIREIISNYPEINIVYINCEINKGKHIAWNRAIEIAKGELFVCADVDDPIEPDSLQFLYEKWSLVKKEPNCCGVLGLVDVYETGDIHAGKWPEDGWKSNYLEFVIKYNLYGETWGVTRTDLLKQWKFPELSNGYWGEHYIWYGLALQGFYYYCYNHVNRHYVTSKSNGITANRNNGRKKPQQLQISLLLALWDLKYTSLWYLKYKKIEWVKMVLKIPYYIYLYLFKSSRAELL